MLEFFPFFDPESGPFFSGVMYVVESLSRIYNTTSPFLTAPRFPFRFSSLLGSPCVSGGGLDALHQSAHPIPQDSRWHGTWSTLYSRDSCLLSWGRKTTFLLGIKGENIKLQSVLEESLKQHREPTLGRNKYGRRRDQNRNWVPYLFLSLWTSSPWSPMRDSEIPARKPLSIALIYLGTRTGDKKTVSGLHVLVHVGRKGAGSGRQPCSLSAKTGSSRSLLPML